MKLRYALILGLLAIMALGGYAVANSLGVEEAREQISEENVPQARLVLEQLDPDTVATGVSPAEATTVVEGLGYQPPDNALILLIRDHSSDQTYWEIGWDQLLFRIDADTGDVLGIADYSDRSSQKTASNEKIGMQNAAEIAKQKTQALLGHVAGKIGEPLTELKVERGETCYKAFWPQSVDGVPVKGGFVNMILHPSGDIKHFSNRWANIDIDTKPTIAEEEAIAIGKERAPDLELGEVLGERIRKANNVSANLVIKKPFRVLDESGPIFGEYALIWEVVFEKNTGVRIPFWDDTGNSPEFVELSLDAHSGEVLGINYSK